MMEVDKMELVYTGQNLVDAKLVCDFLRRQGIAAVLRGEYLPFTDEIPLGSSTTLPSVWVSGHELAQSARRCLEEQSGRRPPR